MTFDQLWAGWRAEYVTGVTCADGPGGAPDRPDSPAGAAGADGLEGSPSSAAGEGDPAGKAGASLTRACVFCAIAGSEEGDEARRVLWSGERSLVVMNAFPYASGHLLVMPRRHICDLEALDAEESAELWAATRDAVVALKAAYGPDGMNLGANLGRAGGAGIPGHLHLHVLPRWVGDTNFMTTVASVRVMPETLGDSWARVVAAWPA